MENSSITERSHLLIIKDYVDHVTYYMLYIEMILCLCLNTVSILFIVSSRLFTPINLLILNLAVFDMLYSCCIPLFVTQFTGGQIQLSLYGCRISYFLDVTCMIVISFTIAGLTLERYMCIKQKGKDTNDRSKLTHVLVYLLIVWLGAAAYSLPKTLYIVLVHEEESGNDYDFRCESTLSDSTEKVYMFFKWALAFILPYAVIVVVSALLVKFLKDWSDRACRMKTKRHEPAIKETNNDMPSMNSPLECKETSFIDKNLSPKTKDVNLPETPLVKKIVQKAVKEDFHMRIKRKSTRFVLLVVFSFLCAWLPLWTFQIYILFTKKHTLALAVMSNVTLVVSYAGGILDPLLYLLLTENFRKSLQNQKEWLRRWRTCFK